MSGVSAYLEGFQAYKALREEYVRVLCPYISNTQQYIDWWEGYEDARDEYMDMEW